MFKIRAEWSVNFMNNQMNYWDFGSISLFDSYGFLEMWLPGIRYPFPIARVLFSLLQRGMARRPRRSSSERRRVRLRCNTAQDTPQLAVGSFIFGSDFRSNAMRSQFARSAVASSVLCINSNRTPSGSSVFRTASQGRINSPRSDYKSVLSTFHNLIWYIDIKSLNDYIRICHDVVFDIDYSHSIFACIIDLINTPCNTLNERKQNGMGELLFWY